MTTMLKMKKEFCLLFFFASAGLVWGVQSEPAFQKLSKSAVVVRIDGRDITKGDILRSAKTMMILGMNKKRKTKIGNAETGAFRRYCNTGVQVAVNRAVVARYATERGLVNSSDVMKRTTRKIERQYGVRSKKLKRWHTLEDLKFMLGKNAPILDAEVTARATYQTVTNNIVTTHPVTVSSQDVTNRMHWIARYNSRMTLTNALVYARATNVWKRIVGKELTFEQAATNYSEDVYISDGCEWGTFGRDQLAEDPEVLALLPTLKIGDITPPLASDGGLAIIRLDEILENRNFTFSRVFFRLPMFFDMETPDQARSELLEQAKGELIKRELDAVKAKMKIEYPSGTNLFAHGCAPLKVTKEDLAD